MVGDNIFDIFLIISTIFYFMIYLTDLTRHLHLIENYNEKIQSFVYHMSTDLIIYGKLINLNSIYVYLNECHV